MTLTVASLRVQNGVHTVCVPETTEKTSTKGMPRPPPSRQTGSAHPPASYRFHPYPHWLICTLERRGEPLAPTSACKALNEVKNDVNEVIVNGVSIENGNITNGPMSVDEAAEEEK
jgi:hypothetical protein